MRLVGRALFGLLWLACWLAVLLAVALAVVEETGVLTGLLRGAVARRLGPLGEHLEIGDVGLRWFEPGLVVHDLRLRSPGDGSGAGKGVELLHLERLHATLAPSPDGLPLRRVHVAGGRTRISDDLLDGLNRIADRWRSREGEGSEETDRQALPPFLLTDLRVELELPDGAAFDIGTVDLRATSLQGGGFELDGELHPSLAGAVTGFEPIHVTGKQWTDGLELRATTDGVSLETSGFRVPPSLGALPVARFSGKLAVSAEARIVLATSTERIETSGTLRGRLFDARLLPRVGDPWLDELEVDLQTDFHPGLQDDLWDRGSWNALARIRGRWNGSPVEAWGELGDRVPGGAWARCFARTERLALDESTLRALGAQELASEAWAALSPTGVADASLEVVLERGVAEDGTVSFQNSALAHMRHIGASGLTFHGFRHLTAEGTLGEPWGVPLPCRDLRGQTFLVWDPSLSPPVRVVLADMRAEHSNGSVTGWGTLRALGEEGDEFDLEFDVPSAVIDQRLLSVLRASRMTRNVPDHYGPMGGTVSTRWRFRQAADTGDSITAMGKIHVEGTTARWHRLPIPLRGTSGDLTLLWAELPSRVRGRERALRPFGIGYDLRNDHAEHAGVTAHVRGFYREESQAPLLEPDEVPPPDAGGVHGIEVDVEEVLLRGQDWEVLASAFPELARQRDRLEAVGSIDISYEGAQADVGSPWLSSVEATPRRVEVTPEFFPRRTTDLQGRVLVRTSGDEDDELDMGLVLAGSWAQGVELAARVDALPNGAADAAVLLAGVDPSNRAFKGALLDVLSTDRGLTGPMDSGKLSLSGVLDVVVRTRTTSAGSVAAPDETYRVFLREASLETGGAVLEDIHGVLEKSGDVLSSPRLQARFLGHPVRLSDALIVPVEGVDELEIVDPLLRRRARAEGGPGFAVQATVDTTDFPIDLLRAAWAPSSGPWSGRLDALGARLVMTNPDDGPGIVSLRGRIRPHEVSFRFGIPVRIDTASIELREMVFERGRARAWGEISGLDALIAERELENASMILGFVDQHLTIDDLDGEFVGGRLRSLGASGAGARKAIGVDLQAPHRFDVALQVEDVQVDRLLRGVFESSIADAGLLHGTLQLAGTPSDVLGLTGRGSLRLDEGRLWSIPAARELFTAFGFPGTAVFDRLRAGFALRDGVVHTHHVEVKSTLLNLVGSGWQDLDGRLQYDLDVRTGLVDRLGVLNRLIYWLNRNLWRVEIRGDLLRPEVAIRSSLLEALGGRRDDPLRRLPLPEFAPLGERF